MSNTETRKTTRELTFRLTTEEYARKAIEAAELNRTLAETNTQFDRIKKQFKGEIEALELKRDMILDTIKQGEEDRTVDCDAVFDFDRNLVSYVYNGEVMLERAMEPHERQLNLIDSNKSETEEAASQ